MYYYFMSLKSYAVLSIKNRYSVMSAVLRHNMRKIFSLAAFRELSWHSMSQFYGQMLSFLGVMLVSRYLGPVNLGLYSFVQNYINIFFTVLTGMDFYFTWQLARSHEVAKTIYNYIAAKFVIGLLAIIFGVTISWMLLPRDVAILSTFMFVPLIFSALTPFWLYALREKMAKQAAIIFSIAATFIFLSKVFIVIAGGSLAMFVLVSSVDIIVIHTLMCFYFLHKKYWRDQAGANLRTSFREISGLLKFSSVSIVYVFLWQIVMRADQLMLPAIKGAYELGIYAAAVKVSEVPNILVSLLGMVVFSRMINIVDSSAEHEKKQTKRIMNVHILAGLASSFFIIIFAPLLVSIIFGGKFLDSVPVLRIYAMSIPGLFVTYYFVAVFAAKEMQKVLAWHALVIGAFTIILLYILTIGFGTLGTAFASVITYSLSAFSLYYLWLRKIHAK